MSKPSGTNYPNGFLATALSFFLTMSRFNSRWVISGTLRTSYGRFVFESALDF